MEKYFVVKEGSNLYKEYFKYVNDAEKVRQAFRDIAEKHKIETHEFYPYKNLGIAPTSADKEAFKTQFKKNSNFFKLNSEINKEWSEMTKDVESWHKPTPTWYLSDIPHKSRTRLFDIGNVLYGSIDSASVFNTEEWMQEMKASEFFKIIEDYESEGK